MGHEGWISVWQCGGGVTNIFHTAVTQLDFQSPEAAAQGAGKSDDGGLV